MMVNYIKQIVMGSSKILFEVVFCNLFIALSIFMLCYFAGAFWLLTKLLNEFHI